MPIELGSFSFGALVGGLIVGGVQHMLSKVRNTENRISSATNSTAENFKNALVSSIIKIENGQVGFKVVKADFIEHSEAMRNFAIHLKGKIRTALDQDWAEYKNWYEDICCREAANCMYPPEGAEEFNRKREINPSCFIDKLLKHTHPR